MNAITVEISKMTLAPGDVVVLRTARVLSMEQRRDVSEAVRRVIPEGVGCIALEDGVTMEVYTAEGVRK